MFHKSLRKSLDDSRGVQSKKQEFRKDALSLSPVNNPCVQSLCWKSFICCLVAEFFEKQQPSKQTIFRESPTSNSAYLLTMFSSLFGSSPPTIKTVENVVSWSRFWIKYSNFNFRPLRSLLMWKTVSHETVRLRYKDKSFQAMIRQFGLNTETLTALLCTW